MRQPRMTAGSDITGSQDFIPGAGDDDHCIYFTFDVDMCQRSTCLCMF
jgi:hypothetical protein